MPPKATNTSRKGLKATFDDGEIFFITPTDSGWLLTTNRQYRRNGTNAYDGWFPRHYTHTRSAKAALTRFLGQKLDWVDN
ncbi:hypothetical protein [Neptuniibacter sp. QD37_11]|uniref:hypothetical protein n=1 Tax=Neptuniibacter sp. QD37_11 TaxID=3398209 RepID=UPI0039F545B9